ncbi:MAG: tetratricopeptide repeat protein [Microcoleus sp.]
MTQHKARRDRGRILTDKGWKKIYDAIKAKFPDGHTFQAISDLTDPAIHQESVYSVSCDTVSNILNRRAGADKVRIESLFRAFGLNLDANDHASVKTHTLLMSNSDFVDAEGPIAHPSIPNQNFVGREGAIAHPSQAQHQQTFALPEKIAPVRNWVGRSREIDTLKSQILDPETRAITITAVCLVGLAGIGKTTLASQFIRQLQAENAPFTAAAWETLRSPTGKTPRFDSIIDSLLLALSNGEITPALTILNDYHQKTDRLVKLLKEKPCLVVLDNVETVLQIGKAKRAGYFADECGEYAWLFSQIAETEHQSKVLFTSRETLAALSGRETKTVPLGGLDPQAAVQLLESFNLIATPEELAELAKRYDGHPKALEIVAALIVNEAEYQGSVCKFLQDVNWLLVNSLDELIDQVIQRLSDEELMCLSQISVYETPEYPLSVDGIAAQMSEMSKRDVKENVIEALKRRQLLDYNRNYESYQMHPLVEEKASHLLNPELAIIAHRKAYRHFLSIVKPEVEWKEFNDVKPLLRAHYHACQAKDWDEAARSISISYEYLRQKSHFDIIIDCYTKLIPENCQSEDKLVRSIYEHCEILLCLGNSYNAVTQWKIAEKYYQKCLFVSRKIGYRQLEASTLCYIALIMGNNEIAIEYLQESIVIATDLEEDHIKCKALEYCGIIYWRIGDYNTSINYHQQALEIARKIKSEESVGIAFGNLGCLYEVIGEYEKAQKYMNQYLEIAIKIGDPRRKAYALGLLSGLYRKLGNYQNSINYEIEGIAICREIQDKHAESGALKSLGITYRKLGEYIESIGLLKRCVEICHEIESHGEGDALYELGITYREVGKLEEALEHFQAGLIIFNQIIAHARTAQSLLELAKTSLLINTVPLETLQDYCDRAENICLDLKLPLLTEVQKLQANLPENRD